jgi:carnitine 3-dehydrogenase
MTFHLGGGDGGITHLLEQFKPAFEARWASMSAPELSDATIRQVIDGVAADRDAVLPELAGGGS